MDTAGEDQECGDGDVRPGIERLAGPGGVIRWETGVERRLHRQEAGVEQASDWIGIGITRVEETQEETARGDCSQQRHGKMVRESRGSHREVKRTLGRDRRRSKCDLQCAPR